MKGNSWCFHSISILLSTETFGGRRDKGSGLIAMLVHENNFPRNVPVFVFIHSFIHFIRYVGRVFEGWNSPKNFECGKVSKFFRLMALWMLRLLYHPDVYIKHTFPTSHTWVNNVLVSFANLLYVSVVICCVFLCTQTSDREDRRVSDMDHECGADGSRTRVIQDFWTMKESTRRRRKVSC